MEELLYKLEVLMKIKEAVGSTYSSKEDCDTYHDCMELLNEVEKDIVLRLASGSSSKDTVNND